MEYSHTPVLLEEVLSYIPDNARNVVDFTLGGGGHAERVLERFPQVDYFGIDRDTAAISHSKIRLKKFGDRVSFIHGSFSSSINMLINDRIKTDFILADLGVSSHQLDSQSRGFSFRCDAPLDMRMDERSTKTARDVVNSYTEKELSRLIRKFGEDPFADRIAKAIVRARSKKPFTTTWQLADCVREGVPKKFQYGKIHPATKTFQAIRIEVNDELNEIQQLLDGALMILNESGTFGVISFQSLEDRLIKRAFNKWKDPCECPKTIPYCVCGEKPRGEIITRGVVRPDSAEIYRNPRARSAKLRVFKKAANHA